MKTVALSAFLTLTFLTLVARADEPKENQWTAHVKKEFTAYTLEADTDTKLTITNFKREGENVGFTLKVGVEAYKFTPTLAGARVEMTERMFITVDKLDFAFTGIPKEEEIETAVKTVLDARNAGLATGMNTNTPFMRYIGLRVAPNVVQEVTDMIYNDRKQEIAKHTAAFVTTLLTPPATSNQPIP